MRKSSGFTFECPEIEPRDIKGKYYANDEDLNTAYYYVLVACGKKRRRLVILCCSRIIWDRRLDGWLPIQLFFTFVQVIVGGLYKERKCPHYSRAVFYTFHFACVTADTAHVPTALAYYLCH